jgi:ribosomal protein S18 acetylase RimI-like enzyme
MTQPESRAWRESAEHHAQLDPYRYHVPDESFVVERYRLGQQHPDATSNETLTLVAELDGVIAGFLDARLERPFDAMHRQLTFCFIADIAVSKEYQNRGAGEQLLRAAEEWGSSRGAEFVALEYLAANEKAARFYEKLGYSRAAVIAMRRLRD